MTHFIEQDKVDEYLTQLRQGERSALALLYEATSKKIYSLCYSYMRNQHDSEDALSDTYVSVVKNIGRYRGEKGFNWLYTIAKNICLNMLREKKREVATDFDNEETVNILNLSNEEEPRCNDESGIIALSQRVLNEKELQIVILHAVNELTFKEISKIIGGLEVTIRWKYNNAIKKVKKHMKGVDER